MTYRQFLKRMIFLTEKLSDIYNAEPLDQDARQSIIDEVRQLGDNFNRIRRRRSWFMILSLFLLFCLLFLLAFRIFL